MQYILYSNGVRLEWDDTITVGELIRTYNDGYHILTKIEFRDEDEERDNSGLNITVVERSSDDYGATPIFHYVKVLKSDGTKSKSITSECDASYCSRVTLDEVIQQYHDEVKVAKNKLNALRNYLPS